MAIRRANLNDIKRLVEIDREAYGETGATKEYFVQKISEFPEGVLVVEDSGKVTGFVVFEVYGKNDIPRDFCDMKIINPVSGKWMFIIAFTTATNYKNKNEDAQLLLHAENAARNNGCVEACVPLSKAHPFDVNGVFHFWQQNCYEKTGTINWVSNLNETVECYFLKKNLK